MTLGLRWISVRNRLAPWLGLLAIPLLGTLLHKTGGAFAPWAVSALFMGTLLWLLLGVGAESSGKPSLWWSSALCLALGAQTVVVARSPRIIYALPGVRANVVTALLRGTVVLAFALALAHLASRGRWTARTRAYWLWAFVTIFFVARVAVMAISPNPFIDVFTSGTLGAQHFLSGLNPYSQTYPDIYGGRYGYNPTFFYGPTYVVWSSLAFILGDIRWATVLAEALSIAAVLSFLRAQRAEVEGRLLLLVWLAFPVYLFILEQTWVDPIVLAALLWSLRACAAQRFLAAGLAAGLALGVKQTALLMLLLTLAWVFRVAGLRAAVRYALGAAITAGVAFVPFLLWDAKGIWHSLVTMVMKSPPRMDALTLTAWFNHRHVQLAPGVLRALSLSTCASLLLWLGLRARTLSDLTSAAVLAYMVVFLCGFQAFCNYYWFVGGLIFCDLLARLAASGSAPVEAARVPEPS